MKFVSIKMQNILNDLKMWVNCFFINFRLGSFLMYTRSRKMYRLSTNYSNSKIIILSVRRFLRTMANCLNVPEARTIPRASSVDTAGLLNLTSKSVPLNGSLHHRKDDIHHHLSCGWKPRFSIRIPKNTRSSSPHLLLFLRILLFFYHELLPRREKQGILDLLLFISIVI